MDEDALLTPARLSVRGRTSLLLDLGNTRLKAALCNDGQLHVPIALALDAVDFKAQLRAYLGAATPHADAWLASVNAGAQAGDIEAELAAAGLNVQRVPAPHSTPQLQLAYMQPQRLGVDRWLAMLAARARNSGAWVVASCGSALTLDAIDASGRHLGGLIAPSPARSREALWQRAPHLRGQPGVVGWFSGNTEDAVESGAVLAAAALIDRFVAESNHMLGATPAVLLSGGGANELRPHLRSAAEVAPWLVLEGLAAWRRDVELGRPESLAGRGR